MTSDHDRPRTNAELRRLAEKITQKDTAILAVDIEALSSKEIRRRFHELRVHQIELEMQNEQLRQAQVALDAERRRYCNCFDMAPVAYCTVSEKGLILEANLSAFNLLGLVRGTLVGQMFTQFILNEDQDRYYLLRRQLFESSELQVCELRMVNEGGTVFWVQLSTKLVRDENSSPLILITVSDITDRKQVETQLFNSKATLAMALDGISDPLIMLDVESRIKRLNKAAMEYYGLTSYGQAIGKYCFEGLRCKSSPCEGCEQPFSFMQGFSGSYERKGEMDPDQLKQVVVDLVKDELGATEATIIRIYDVTQAKIIDRQLIQSEKLATLGLLIAGIAHEINNPNNFIFFNIPILRSYFEALLPIVDEYVLEHPDLQVFDWPYSDFREDCFKLLGNVEHGSIRINQIINNLKEFVRERGKGEARRIDLKQVIEKGLFMCQGRIRKTVKTFEVDIPEGLPALYSDPLAIEQVVVNLLINAIQAMDKEDSWVRVRIIGPAESDGEVMVEVSDNGCGMDVETQRKIFDPFFTTKAAGVGTGLGLSITHRLLAELGGRIEVKSEVGKGSVFLVFLKAMTAPLNQMKTG